MTIKVGLCGWTIAALRYVERFSVLEVQQTFYQPPDDKVLQRWRALVPAEFEFTVKAWMLITHRATSPTYRRLRRELTDEEHAGAGSFQDTPIVHEAWKRTLACTRLLRGTSILFQCPASFKPTDENLASMRRFFARIDRERTRPADMRLMFEPRGKTWTKAIVAPLCAELGLVHVVDPLVHRTVTTGVRYYRLHGTTGARHVYTDTELAKIASLVPKRGETYVMFNNMPRVGDSARFMRLVGLSD
ncbi:MAG: hypothetical protein JWP01_2764 [Myxococcales bacterium]|nr:hypothetical protein [Myxococcales bacterium]